MQLIVLGMHRSGTSVLARLLNLMGAYFGPEGVSTGANEENPKGFWERKDVRALNDKVLHSIGCDWNRVSTFDLARVPPQVADHFHSEAKRLLLGMDAYRPWFIKEPRLCLLLPLWLPALEAPICIRIVRSPIEVAASLNKRNGVPLEAGLHLWTLYNLHAWSAAKDLPQVVVSHRELITTPRASVRRLVDELAELGAYSLRLPTDREIDAFIESSLYRERDTREDLSRLSSIPHNTLYDMLLTDPHDAAQVQVLSALTEMSALREYESRLPPVGLPASDARNDLLEEHKKVRSELTARLRSADEALRASRAEVAALSTQLSENNQLLDDLKARLADREAALQAGADEIRDLSARLQDAESGASRLEAELSQSQVQLADREAALQAGADEIRDLSARLQDATEAKAGFQQELDARFKELATLTALLLAAEQDLNDARARAAQLHEAQSIAARLEVELSWLKRGRIMRFAHALQNSVHILRRRAKRRGALSVIRRSGLFDCEWYKNAYPDVARTGMDPIVHYYHYGAAEGRNPSATFQTTFYLRQYPDVAQAQINPLLHYILHGAKEGRIVNGGRLNG